MIAALAVAALLSALADGPAAPVADPPAEIERRLALMGTGLTLMVEADTRPQAIAASERAVRALEATEARLSTWREDSELARLNRAAPGRPAEVSPELAADLAAVRRCWEETGGAFDPTVGALAAAWGIRAGGRVPTEGERRTALAATGTSALDLAAGPGGATATRGRAGLTLDEGGFGKGAGLDRALAALASSPGVRRAWLDLGGQVAVASRGRGERWRVALADPADRRRPVVALSVGGGSVATSGTGERGGHLLDPRSGRPAADFGSLSVWAPEAVRADCLSTGLYVLGAEAALAWAAARPEVEVVVLVHDGGRLVATATPGLVGRLEPLAPEVEIEFFGPRTVREGS